MDHLGGPGVQSETAVLLDNPEEITTYSWRRMAPTLAQLLGCCPEEMAAFGDWQNKSDQPDVGQMAFHYSSAKYAASIKIESLVWGAASKLTDQLSWEAIPQEELDKARSHGLAEAERLLRQYRQPIWASSQKLQDVRKRLKLPQQFMEAEKARQEADAAASPLMPDQLNGKVLTATLKNGRAICPEFQTDECPNPADDCPFGVHFCAILQKSGRACGGKHGAGVCNIKRAVVAASSLPAAPKNLWLPNRLNSLIFCLLVRFLGIKRLLQNSLFESCRNLLFPLWRSLVLFCRNIQSVRTTNLLICGFVF